MIRTGGFLKKLPYDTIRYTIVTCTQKLTNSQLNLPHGTKQKSIMKKLKTKNRDAHIRNGQVIKSVESVLRPEGSPWLERLVKEIGCLRLMTSRNTAVYLYTAIFLETVYYRRSFLNTAHPYRQAASKSLFDCLTRDQLTNSV